MPITENVCGQRIDYDLPIRESFSEREEAIYDNAYSEVENTLSSPKSRMGERTRMEKFPSHSPLPR